jgi:hypothetical protein
LRGLGCRSGRLLVGARSCSSFDGAAVGARLREGVSR